jgi:hypothetical protein
MLTDRRRIAMVAIVGVLLLAGFAFGRMTSSTDTAKAFTSPTNAATSSPSPAPEPAIEAQTFYLSDFRTGYGDGYTSGLTSQGAATTTTTRPGYNDGFKQGFADGYQARMSAGTAAPPETRFVSGGGQRERVVYRSSYRERPTFVQRKRNSTLKTVLTIAAPAAIGAGVGGAVGGGKGMGYGALIGGGGGALYHLIRNR